MILKKLEMRNIRSYKQGIIEFPEGSTLLMGDIGSGKTSVLLAIEFALFGLQPSQKGTSLLRSNEDEGFVRLEFEIDEKQVSIERKIKKSSKSITQCDASISINNERFDGSISEVKDKVLQLLSYPIEFRKKTNDLYKFTVYTPQEEMKQIILETSEARLNTLRHVFGIDKYKRISENLDTIGIKLRQEIRLKEAQLGDIHQKNLELKNKQQTLITEQQKITELDSELDRTKAKKQVKETEIKELETKIIEKTNLEKEKAKTEIMINNKKETITNYEREVTILKQQVEEGKKFSYNQEKVNTLKTHIINQEKILKQVEEEHMNIATKIQSQENRKIEIQSLKSKIIGLEKCPTCLQEVNEQYKLNITTKADEEINVILEQTDIYNKKKQELSAKIMAIEKQIDAYKSSISEMEILKIKLQGITEKETKIIEIETQKLVAAKDLIMIQDQIKRFNDLIEDFSKYTPIYEQKNNELKELVSQEHSFMIKKAETNKEIQFLDLQIKDLNEEIQKITELSKKINDIKELESWLSNKFSQLISFTEKNVMLKLREEFSDLFAQWFSILVADTLTVRLDETFSPIINQQDYELDYNFLSGGERTAVALAYRLSLNQVINSLLSKIKTHDLVILDEPTDGFSDSQLDKMRDVLDQLKVRQLILVSHEQKIEGFVDNIIRFKKQEGITEIEA